MKLTMIYTLCGSVDEAKKIAQFLIGQNAAACVNILSPTTSHYRWEGKIETATEIPVLVKTSAEKANEAADVIRTHHAYKTPAIVTWEADSANPSYSTWVKENLA